MLLSSHAKSRQHRQLFWRIPWSGVNSLLAALLAGFLVWGPLNGSLTAVAIVGPLTGVVALALWSLQTRAALRGDGRRARHLGRWLLGVPLSLVAAALLVATVQLYTLGALGPTSSDRVAEFERLWKTLDRHYVYFEQKGVDWDAVYAQYRPIVAEAGDDSAYFRSIYAMLAELRDGHTGLQEPPILYEGLHMFGVTREMAGEAVVVMTGRTAASIGLVEGAVVLAVNGEPVETRLAYWMERLAGGSSPWHHRRTAHFFLLATYDDSLDVTFENLDGDRQTATLRFDPTLAPQDRAPDTTAPVTSERLPSGVGIIRITDFAMNRGPGLIRGFDRALDGMMDAPGIIIDVRGHNGGFSVWGDLIAGRFFEKGFEYGRTVFRTRLPQHLWRRSMAFRVTARGETYTGPVVLLIDHNTFSSGETFAVAMADSGRAYAIGRRTAGATGNPVTFRLRGGRARYSTGNFRRNDGRELEGAGVEPDLTVTWTRDDFLAGTDPDVAAAEAYLLSRNR